MKIWLDDEREHPVGWHRARTFEDAIILLSTGKANVISLDHDLGTEKTGYDVICWIEEKAHDGEWENVPNEIRLHTANPVGRKRMEYCVKNIQRMRIEQNV